MQIILLLIAHFIGDFICQPNNLSEAKKKNINYLLLHSAIYTFFMAIVLMFFVSAWVLLILGSLIFATHLVIDYIKIRIDRNLLSSGQNISFFVDQGLHILVILIIPLLFVLKSNAWGLDFLLLHFSAFQIKKALVVALAYIIAWTPSSIIVKHMLNLFEKKDACDESNEAGSLIGKLERVVILTLGLMGLEASIALVFTAKSLARFKQLDDKEFAEKYIIGTLISLLISLILLIIVKKIAF